MADSLEVYLDDALDILNRKPERFVDRIEALDERTFAGQSDAERARMCYSEHPQVMRAEFEAGHQATRAGSGVSPSSQPKEEPRCG